MEGSREPFQKYTVPVKPYILWVSSCILDIGYAFRCDTLPGVMVILTELVYVENSRKTFGNKEDGGIPGES